jgi:hypothetical protein
MKTTFVHFALIVTVSAVACAQTFSFPTWNGSFQTSGFNQYNFTMVGTDPGTTNQTTNVTAYIVPVSVTIQPAGGNNVIFDPQSIVQNALDSPVLCGASTCTVDFEPYGTDLGTTQYGDAFQRGNFWTANVQNNTQYHVLLSPVVLLSEQSVSASGHILTTNSGPEQIGVLAGSLDNFIEQQLTTLAGQNTIQPNSLVIFLTRDICTNFPTGCGAWGTHSYFPISHKGTFAWTWASYGDVNPSDFPGVLIAPDVDALAHEVAEWIDDPRGNNPAPCGPNADLEVGDPFVGYSPAEYVSHGFTYHLPYLTWLAWFGQAPRTSIGENLLFPAAVQGYGVCQNPST